MAIRKVLTVLERKGKEWICRGFQMVIGNYVGTLKSLKKSQKTRKMKIGKVNLKFKKEIIKNQQKKSLFLQIYERYLYIYNWTHWVSWNMS